MNEIPVRNTDSSIHGRILDALEQGGPWKQFDHIIAAAAVDALIARERKKAVEDAFALAQTMSPEAVITKMFPSILG